MESSSYWQEQIDITVTKINELALGELSGVHSVDGEEDSLVFNDVEKQYKVLQTHLSFCKSEKQYALDIENEKIRVHKIITYIPRM